MALFVAGGRIAEGAVARINEYIEKYRRANPTWHKVLVLDAETEQPHLIDGCYQASPKRPRQMVVTFVYSDDSSIQVPCTPEQVMALQNADLFGVRESKVWQKLAHLAEVHRVINETRTP